MKFQEYFNIVARSKKEFHFWIQQLSVEFKCVQFIFPASKDDKKITTIIFYLKNSDILIYDEDGTAKKIKGKFKKLLTDNGLPEEVIGLMKIEIDSHENVVTNFDGNYFHRMR